MAEGEGERERERDGIKLGQCQTYITQQQKAHNKTIVFDPQS